MLAIQIIMAPTGLCNNEPKRNQPDTVGIKSAANQASSSYCPIFESDRLEIRKSHTWPNQLETTAW